MTGRESIAPRKVLQKVSSDIVRKVRYEIPGEYATTLRGMVEAVSREGST